MDGSTPLFSADDVGVLVRAAAFAADRHKNQRRKDQAASPYINHPLKVAQLLYEVGAVRDMPTLVAALLHDTVEDTETTAEEIEHHFGPEVRRIVLEVTDDKSLPKARRKALQIAHAPHLSPAAQALKLADKCCNIHDLTHNPPAGWPDSRVRAYLDWAAEVVTGLRAANGPLAAHFDQLHAAARARVGA